MFNYIPKNYLVAGISTNVGKTLASAILCKKLNAAYFKPIQAGDLENSDSIKIKQLVPKTQILPEIYRLQNACSPHQAAATEKITIDLEKIQLPQVQTPLIVEIAGGIMTPVNHRHTFIDIIEKFRLPVILVINYYLGSINHSLLSLEVLKRSEIKIAGLIFSGEKNSASFNFILQHSQQQCLLEIPQLAQVGPQQITELAELLVLP